MIGSASYSKTQIMCVCACACVCMLSGCTPLCEMPWWRRWQRRTHNFEGALDLHLAVVAVNIARYVTLARRQRQPQPHCPAGATGGDGEAAAQSKEKDGRGLTLLDPCTGTGTLGAAAIGCGKCNAIHTLKCLVDERECALVCGSV